MPSRNILARNGELKLVSRTSKNTAFSLIELSIVILIIGILIAGVTQSSRLIAQMRLSSARSQTQSSPVASISNLMLWLETTSEKSFDDAATEDGTAINSGSNYAWYDINPQNSYKYSATSATGPQYKINCINSLPCLSFNGTSQFLSLPAMTNASQLSIFIVYNNVSTSAGAQHMFSASEVASAFATTAVAASSTSGLNYFNSAGSSYGNVGALRANTAAIVEIIDKGTAGSYLYYTVPNAAMSYVGPASASSARNFSNGASIGSYYNGTTRAGYFNGYLAEIIVFDRGLKNEEKRAIEAYLTKKWGIRTL